MPFCVKTLTVLATAAALVTLPQIAQASNADAADTTNALSLAPGSGFIYNLTGTGVRIGIFEAGAIPRADHQEFQLPNGGGSIITVVDNIGFGGHATNVAGVIAGNGIGGSQYRGMAPDVRIRAYSSTNANAEIERDAALLDITNHSYSTGAPAGAWDSASFTVGGVTSTYETWNLGTTDYRDKYNTDPVFGRYRADSVDIDDTLHKYPKVLSFYSAGNTRGSQFGGSLTTGKYVATFSPGFTPVGGTNVGGNNWLVSVQNYPAPGTGLLAYDTLAAVGTAKNNVVVGSISAYTTDPHPLAASATISSFTNWGPTDDGRIGVTVVGNGAGVSTADSDSATAYIASTSGTSFSSPNVAGTAALILQYWRQRTNNYTPFAATQKALLIHTATDVVVGGQVGPDYRTGYGIVNGLDAVRFINAATSANTAARTDHFVETSIAPSTQNLMYFVSAGEAATTEDPGGIRASLVWTDPEGVANSTTSYNNRAYRTLVNDLDLWITDALGNTYYPYTLNPDDPSAAAVQTRRNDVDNMEQIFIAPGLLPLGAAFTVHISIDGILQSNLPQNYSLLLSGGFLVPEPSALSLLLLPAALLRRRR